MNEAQAFSAIRNVVRLENLSAKAAQRVTPELTEIFKALRAEIERLPAEAIGKELRYRQLLQQMQGVLRGPNDQLYASISETLRDEVENQVEWAAGYLEKAGEAEPVGVSLGPAAGEGPTAVNRGAGITRTQLTALADDSKVLGKRLGTLFGVGGDQSAFINSQIKKIDQVVKQGFLLGQTNDEIARGIASAGAQSLREARAIARTAVMDMSQRAHNTFWDAQDDDLIAGWEFDASMDNRVCPTCAPFDGRTGKKRSDLPEAPVHVNCRCRVLPLTATELLLREEQGPQRRTVTELIPVDQAKTKEAAMKEAKLFPGAKAARAYSRQVKGPDGKKYWRVAVDVERGKQPLTMGEFLKDATPATKAQVLGSKKKADRFMDLISDRGRAKAKMTPDSALAEVTKDVRPAFKDGTRSALQSPAIRPGSRKLIDQLSTSKPKPKAARKPKAPTLPTVRELGVDSPAVSIWMKDYGGSGRLVDDALTRVEKEGGLIGKHAKQLRQFTEQNRVMSHYSMREQIGDYSATYGKQIDSIIASQKRTVETMLKTATPQKIQDKARALLDDLQAPGERRELALKSLFGKHDGCAGYTRSTTGAVNVYLESESKPLGQLGMAEIKRRHEDNLLDAVAVANGQQVPLPFLTSSGVNKKVDWLTVHVHEMGHQVHFKGLEGAAYGGKHKAKGGIAAVSQYGLTNEYERFAEAYSQYVFNPEGLKKHAPGLYSWVEEAVTNALKL